MIETATIEAWPRLETPDVTEEGLEKGAKLAQWLDQLSRVPEGIRLFADGCVEFDLDYYTDGEENQCAVIIPGVPLPTERMVRDRRDKDRNQDNYKHTMPPVTEPVAVRSFEISDCYKPFYEVGEDGRVPIVAKGIGWVLDGHDRGVELSEIFQYDPTAHQLAIVDNWHHSRTR